MRFDKGIVWFRRDLRAHDHTALHHALAQCRQVLCVFVFDRAILDELPRADRRVEFIHGSVLELHERLAVWGGGLTVLHAHSEIAIPKLAQQTGAQAVFASHDDEPYALTRDASVRGRLSEMGCALFTYKDHVVFERREVLTQAGQPFSVFTPYKNAWLKRVAAGDVAEREVKPREGQLLAGTGAMPSLADLSFEKTNLQTLGVRPGAGGGAALLADFLPRMADYERARNLPAIKGPSYLGVHLRFGTVSIRELVRAAWPAAQHGEEGARVWLSELIWRDFYAQILANFPHVAQRSFKAAYDRIAWEKGKRAESLFSAWCEGRTGYPIVDAAMAQINQTGYMHNRLRMIVASFLTKDLGIDWRWGERYFAEKLIDFDLSANNGGWQWASSSGCDAQPYFRIFNPTSQSEKFDPEGKFIRRYLPQLAAVSTKALHAPWLASALELQAAGVEIGKTYPSPLVHHDEARRLTLERYAVVKANASELSQN
jgi:deoxyribodipyrimidine photo-lyase